MIDRTKAPDFKIVDDISIVKARKEYLDNQIPVYILNAGEQEVVKVEFVFEAGVWHQDKPLISSATNSLLNEGTENMTSAEIAEKLDYYGAYLGLDSGQHTSSVVLYTLNKHFNQTISVINEILKKAIFPEKELKTYILNKKQEFILNQQKVEKIARKEMNKILFGKNHPYGIYIELDDFDSITTNDLKNFYQKYYSSDNCRIVISGNVNEMHYHHLNFNFGQNDWLKKEVRTIKEFKIQTEKKKRWKFQKEDALQSAIRFGKVMVNKTHSDWTALHLVSTILGGYFGSRLMTNIREQKGYTYGIGSAVISLKDAGYFVIASEVAKEVSELAVDEVRKELKILCNELVSDTELDLVRNYILGDMLQTFDGPLALSAAYKGILDYNLDYDYFYKIINEVKNITPKKILETANKYFNEETLYEVIVGY